MMGKNNMRALYSGIAARIASTGMQTVTLIFLARDVEVVSFGLYASTLSIGVVLGAILNCGSGMRVIYLSSVTDRTLRRDLRLVSLIGSTCAGASSLLLASLIWGGSYLLILSAAAIAAVVEITYTTEANAYFAQGRVRRGECLILGKRIPAFAAVLISLLIVPGLLLEFYVGGLVFSAVMIIVGVLWKLGPSDPLGFSVVRLARANSHYWLASVMGTVQQLDVLIVGGMLGGSQAGGYAAGYRIASPAHLLTSSITSLLVPKVANADLSKIDRKASLKLLDLSVSVYVVVLICSAPVVAVLAPYLLGESFEEYRWVFGIFVVNAAVSSWVQSRIGVANSFGRSSIVSRSITFITFLSLLLMALSSALGSLVAVCGVLLGSQVVLAVILTVVAKRGSKCALS